MKIVRKPVIPRQRKYGRIFFLKRKNKSVVVKVSVIPVGSPITGYGVRLTTHNDAFSPEEALAISDLLSVAYSHAKRLEKVCLGKPISSSPA